MLEFYPNLNINPVMLSDPNMQSSDCNGRAAGRCSISYMNSQLFRSFKMHYQINIF